MARYRVLVKGSNWLGDAVLSLPTIRGIKLLKPNARVTVLSRESIASLYDAAEGVDETLPYSSNLNAIRQLRGRKFEACLILPRSFSSALVTALARIPLRIGYAADSRSVLLTVPVPRGTETLKTHRVYYYFNLLRGFAPTPPIPRPRLRVPPEAAEWARERLSGIGDGPWIGMNPGAAYGDAKRWKPDRFARLGRRLVRQHEARILVLGGPAEKDLTGEVAKGIGSAAVDLGGRTTLPQLIALIKRCALFVSNDTGPMHVADALGRPIVAIFGPTDPVATRPFGHNHVIVRQRLDCAPCFKRSCPLKHHDCMERVAVTQVYDACVSMLKAG